MKDKRIALVEAMIKDLERQTAEALSALEERIKLLEEA